MKNFDGIFRLPATCEELGKNAPVGPSPSSSIDSGATDGFLIAYCLLHVWRRYHEATEIIAATKSTAVTVPNPTRADRLCPHHMATKIETATAAVITCNKY